MVPLTDQAGGALPERAIVAAMRRRQGVAMPVELITELPDLVARLDSHLVRVQGRRHRGATGIRWGTDGSIVAPLHAVEHAYTVTLGLPDGRAI